MGCEWAGMRVREQLVAQRLWYHQLDGIAIPSDEDLVFEDNGGSHRQSFRPFKDRARSWTVAL